MNRINSTVWIFILIAVFIISCSAVEETSKEEQKEDEFYIFDEIPDENSFAI